MTTPLYISEADVVALLDMRGAIAALAEEILKTIREKPLYYTEIAERFSAYEFNTVARALGHLHTIEKLWQDPEGRMCERGSRFAAKLPGKG